MASYFPLAALQQIFSPGTSDDAPALNATHPMNTTTSATAGQTAFPVDASSFIAFAYSFSALRDWLKLIVIGGLFEWLFESCRRLVTRLYDKVVGLFFIRASFEETDASYLWILVWLSRQPSWSKTRDMQITTRAYGGNSPAVDLDGEEQRANEFFETSRKISYLPSVSLTYSLWYKRRWMTITRVQQQSGMRGEKENTLYINILTRDHDILKQLLQEARRYYMAGQQHNMCVYVSDSTNRWNHVACRAKRSMNSIVLDPGIKDILLEDARDFLRSKPWYAERGIPFRRGYLLYGAPGSGKTSMIHCMAGELGLDVYIVSLSRTGLDDASLSELVNALPERCIALMEDIDAAFTHGVSRGGLPGSGQEEEPSKTSASQAGPPGPTTSKLSLSGLLNALDGVGAQEGRILFATTNKYTALDPALCRPGRMDLHVEFKNASKYQARELFKRFYLPTPSSEAIGAEEKEERVDSGYEADSIQAAASETSEDVEQDNEKKVVTSDSSAPDVPSFTGQTHIAHGPKLSRARIARLAAQFSDAIPERECSMASLQGYLMTYKTRPVEAALEVAAWVEEEREKRQLRDREEKAKEAKAKDVEEAKGEGESDDRAAAPPMVATSAPALARCSCQRVPTCATCGGAKVETISLALPSPVSSPVSPIPEPLPQSSKPADVMADLAMPSVERATDS
ncbi:putative AAA ATPase family protein [Lyophyllum shimeji]|uniref:AAA ATPase family protein n=1 Tax=Lyophyllum shimeji TaxID=47721 RepID=A0A9P3PQV8_LYOSH|nr:putative AAA ATPase family protein [Lyophyllum shimeji]